MKILITGAGTGIGRDAAIELAKRGHQVIATTHTEAQARDLGAAIDSKSIEVGMLDITNQSSVDGYKNRDIDVIINNAAVGESGPVCEIPLDRMQNLLNTNVMGTVRVTQAFVPQMVERKSGRVIIVSSIAGRFVVPFLGPYSMTKFALEAAGDSLRTELKPHGIHVSLIEPGLIYTGFNERMAVSKYEWLKPDSIIGGLIERLKKHDAKISAGSFTTAPVVESIAHAVESRHPKTRYITPKSYRLSIELLRIMPDRMKDKIAKWAGGI